MKARSAQLVEQFDVETPSIFSTVMQVCQICAYTTLLAYEHCISLSIRPYYDMVYTYDMHMQWLAISLYRIRIH